MRDRRAGVVEADRGEPVVLVEHDGEVARLPRLLHRVDGVGVDPRVPAAHLTGAPSFDTRTASRRLASVVGVSDAMPPAKRLTELAHDPRPGGSVGQHEPAATARHDVMQEVTAVVTTGVIVTGGASGIGRASAHALAASGRPVALWDLDGAKAEYEATEITARSSAWRRSGSGSTCATRPTSPRRSSAAATRSARSAASSTPPGNTGARLDRRARDRDLGRHDRHPPHRRGAPDPRPDPDFVANPGSAVVLISSIEGIVSHWAIPSYCSAKAGMLGLARSSGAHLGVQGIRVQRRVPGLHRDADVPPGGVRRRARWRRTRNGSRSAASACRRRSATSCASCCRRRRRT